MLADAAPEDDPLTQDADAPPVRDAAVARWLLAEDERGNPSTGLRAFSAGNSVEPLVDGAAYFSRLCHELTSTAEGDQVYLLDFRGDLEERLGGPGTEIGALLADAADRGVLVFGLLWRSHPKAFQQSEEANAAFVRHVCEHGGDVLLDARTRRGGSHHQKLVVIRHPAAPERDVAFIGGIDLGYSRRDDNDHTGDEQTMAFPEAYGDRPSWHDLQAEVRGPAVHDLEHTFRERWYGSTALDIPSPVRQLYDRAYHASAMTGRPLPEPLPEDPTPRGTSIVQVLRTYPARLRRYPFAPQGERSIAHSYRKALRNARRLIYVEDQYLWSRDVAEVFAQALRANPELHFVAVLPRFSDREGWAVAPTQLGRDDAVRMLRRAGGDRVHLFDVENHEGEPVYVHAKAVIVDDVWAVIGSDNLNRRSWTHDSELSVAVLDEAADDREPLTLGVDDVRRFARDLRLRLAAEHLDLDDPSIVVDPKQWLHELDTRAVALRDWHAGGQVGPRPPGRLQPHVVAHVPRSKRWWAVPLYRLLFDPDGRAYRDRLRRRP
ncbi:MAG TPA: phospholipase D family protein [Candidatus Nanopelagicales bacterium]|nr:phospholipase D family protein [Candidatus Nanopelagicales bacterium]